LLWSKFAVRLNQFKAILNQLSGVLPGHPQPFDLKKFLLNPNPQKIWELPDEARLRSM
jgi:hypothetical protein